MMMNGNVPKKACSKDQNIYAWGTYCQFLWVLDVYAFNTQEQRKRLWKFINDTCNKTYGDLLIGGGFITVSLVEYSVRGKNNRGLLHMVQ